MHEQRIGLGHFHHLLVDVQAARGVEDQNVVTRELRGLQRTARDVGGGLARHDRERGDAGLFAQDLQLLLRGGRLLVIGSAVNRIPAISGRIWRWTTTAIRRLN